MLSEFALRFMKISRMTIYSHVSEFSKYFLIFERKKSNLIFKFSCDFNLVHNYKPAKLGQVVPIQARLIYNFHKF
jgi:hypothetical protein